MATLTCLPEEVIQIILENRSISIKDIVNFRSTCKSLQQFPLNNKFWERKFYQRCSTAKKKYDIDKQKEILGDVHFKSCIKEGIKCIIKLQYYMSLMSEKMSRTNSDELERLLCSTSKESLIYYFVLDEMNRILSTHLPWQLGSNLAITHQVGQIIYFLKSGRFLHKQTKTYTNMPVRKQLLERLLTTVAQFFVPHVSYSIIKMWLDNITQEVLSCLKKRYPAHSIFSISLEQFSFWKNNNIDDNFWSETEAKQIMCVLEEFIFSALEIHKLFQLLVTTDREKEYTLFISQPLRKYLLTTTYHCVARRFGVRCVLVVEEKIIEENPVGIAWRPKYNANNSKRTEFFYMKDESHLSYPSNIVRGEKYCDLLVDPRNDMWKTYYMIEHFYHELIEDYKCTEHYKGNSDNLFNFSALHAENSFASRFVQNEFDNTDYENIEIKFRIGQLVEDKSDVVKRQSKRRNTKIKFAIGMIVSHSSRLYLWQPIERNSNHDGVIIGWDRKCEYVYQYFDSILPYNIRCHGNWHICNEINGSEECFDQPHYIILSENNGICYIHQDALSMCQPKWINNIGIGQFFSRFEGTHYVPNESLAKEYPSDIAVISEMFSSQ